MTRPPFSPFPRRKEVSWAPCIRHLLHLGRTRLSHGIRDDSGAAAVFMIFGLMAVLVGGAFVIDTQRMVSDSAQIKRATDAAAIAIAHQWATGQNEDFDPATLADQYVRANTGLDETLKTSISSVEVSETTDTPRQFTVTATFAERPKLIMPTAQMITIQSTAEAEGSPREVALVLPSSADTDIPAMQDLANDFVDRLFGSNSNGDPNETVDNTWVSVVPYSQAVNVYDPDDEDRITRWAADGALTPSELDRLWASGYSGHDDAAMPDRRADLLCMFRGLTLGENYDWDQAPDSSFGLYYRYESAGNTYNNSVYYSVSWTGPDPWAGGVGVWATRTIINDPGCPKAAVLPLDAKRSEIEDRIDEISEAWNTNLTIGLSWGGVALSPEMRGSSGWGDEDLPKDFHDDDDGSDSGKYIVMLASSVDQNWGDTDAYNSPDFPMGKDGYSEYSLVSERMTQLCESFRERNIDVYFLAVRSGDPDDFSGTAFDSYMVPGLFVCTDDTDRFTYFDGTSFSDVESSMKTRLEEIADEINAKGIRVRLVE